MRLPDGEVDGADLGLGAVGRQDVGALWPGQRAAGGGEGQVEHLHHICSGNHIMFLSAIINPIISVFFLSLFSVERTVRPLRFCGTKQQWLAPLCLLK